MTAATYAREPWFSDLYNGRAVVHAMRRIQDSDIAETLAYVVMPDHLHWLFRLKERCSLSAAVGSMKSQSARIINRTHRARRRIWQRGYYDHVVRDESNLVTVAKYLLQNPVTAGLVEQLEDYALWDSVWIGGGSR